MDIEINDTKQQASFKNGKFYHTFTPSTANQTVKLYHMGCVGDTRLNRIQLEQGTEPTGFVEPKNTTNTISGIFKNLRDLDVMMKDPDSDMWTKIKKTAKGTVEEYHTNTIKNEIVKTAEGIVERQTKTINSSVDDKINGVRTQLDTAMNNRVTALTSESKRYADGISETLSRKVDGVTNSVATVSRTVDGINNNITSLEGKVLKKNEISITNNGIQLGSGNKIDGNTIASILSVQPKSIDLISPHVRVTGDMIVDGTIEGKKIKSSTIETGHLKTGSVTSEIIASNAIKSKHLLVDDAMIEDLVSHKAFVTELWSQQAFINNLKTIKVTATSIDTEQLKGKEIEGVTIKGGTIDASVITGETKIKIGEHGYMRPAGNGLRFCLPETDNANKGVGVQMLGNYGRGDSPCGLYVYKDPDFDTSETEETDSYLMTVKGYIKTKGINNLKFENHQDSSTSIGIWNKNVSLLFDNTDNDIYYVWKSKYSLWGIITQHYDTTSDVRLKKDIKKCEYNALDLIDDFNFKSFNWKYHEEFGQKPYTEIGLIAQDVEKINKNFVAMAGEYKTLNQFNLLTYSLKAIQELSTQNNELQQRIIKLEEIING